MEFLSNEHAHHRACALCEFKIWRVERICRRLFNQQITVISIELTLLSLSGEKDPAGPMTSGKTDDGQEVKSIAFRSTADSLVRDVVEVTAPEKLSNYQNKRPQLPRGQRNILHDRNEYCTEDKVI